MTRILSRKLLSVLLALVIVAAMILTLASCGKTEGGAETPDSDQPAESVKDSEPAPDSDPTPASDSQDDTASEPAATKTITVEVVDDKGEKTEFVIKTDRETLADALLDEKLVEGTTSEEYGLMIDTVNGLRADYTLDGAYWAMYQDGEYMMTGASQTIIADGDHYELVYTAA